MYCLNCFLVQLKYNAYISRTSFCFFPGDRNFALQVYGFAVKNPTIVDLAKEEEEGKKKTKQQQNTTNICMVDEKEVMAMSAISNL